MSGQVSGPVATINGNGRAAAELPRFWPNFDNAALWRPPRRWAVPLGRGMFPRSWRP